MSMFDWLKQKKQKQQDTPIVEKSEGKVVEDVLPQGATKHVIADPCDIMADYSMWELCAQVPVALDGNGWCTSAMFPSNSVTYNYLNSFKSWPKNFRKLPLVRTVMKYELSKNYTITDKKTGHSKTFKGCSMWLFPTGWVHADDDWLLHMTPEIRKDMAKRIREYKQLSEILNNTQNSR